MWSYFLLLLTKINQTYQYKPNIINLMVDVFFSIECIFFHVIRRRSEKLQLPMGQRRANFVDSAILWQHISGGERVKFIFSSSLPIQFR